MFKNIFIILLLFSIVSCASTQDKKMATEKSAEVPLTVIMVRHAEKQHGQKDPGLTKEGIERAKRLSVILERVELDAAFSSPYNRTQTTAELALEGHQLAILEYSPSELEAFASRLKTDYKGKTVLVVGHSNTTPKLAGLLEGNDVYSSFDESDYGNLVIVTIPSSGLGKTVFLRY